MLSIDDVRAATRTLDGVAHRTPVMTSRTLDHAVGARVHLKCESFQRGGAFKFRGAYNFLSSLSPDVRAKGVCAVSSGNHAQAVAIAARELGTNAAILMPEDAPAVKAEATRGYGAEVVTYDRYATPPVVAGARFAEERGVTFVPAYDDPRIAAGAGTGALEVFDEVMPDVVVVPIGGGGVMSGWATVAKALNPRVRVVGVENAANGSTRQSLQAGHRVTIELKPHLMDGQMLTTPGEFTFDVMKRLVDDVVLVTDEEVLTAMAFLFDRLKLVTEPSGASATAALLAGHVRPSGGTVAALVSGGNVGLRRFAELASTPSRPAAPA